MTNPAGFTASTSNVPPIATEMNIDDVTIDNFGRYGVIKGVKLTSDNKLQLEDKTLETYNSFNITYPEADATYDVYGVSNWRNKAQFLPLEFVEVETPVEFGITVTPAEGTYTEPQLITISVAGVPEGQTPTITYTIGDGAAQTYTAPFTLYKSATITVMAECGEESDIQEYEYTINLPDLAFTMTPAPGTYQGEQNVTIACSNPIEGCELEVEWTYTPTEGDPITGDQDNMTFTAAKSGVLSITAIESETNREFEGTFNYTITEPITIDGDIIFKDNGADGNAKLDGEGVIAEITTGADLVEDVIVNEYIYAGATGLKFSNSSKGGTMTLNLANKYNATKISFIAKAWSNPDTGNTDEAKFTVNNKEFDLTGDFASYDITFETAQELEAITFAATKRAYLKAISIEGTPVAPSNYTITVDNAAGTYEGKVEVKATLTPELEGATLTYTFAEAGATETPAEQAYQTAGVTLTKSGTLTFIARNGQTELARLSGDYTINPLFGDLNYDGEVDVADVNILVNIILGTHHPNN